MPHTFSSTELDRIARANALLLSPLDFPTVDGWRAAVNRHLSALLNADSAGFLLPLPGLAPVFSEEHDAVQLARYPDYPPPPWIDGTPLWEYAIRVGVSTVKEMYGHDYRLYENSAYHQEYAGANGAHDTLAAVHSLGGSDARGAAIMHFWHDKPTGRAFGERETAILRVVFPAFQAGAEMVARLGGLRNPILEVLDSLGYAVMVFDSAGRPLHRTSALTALLARDPESNMLLAEITAAIERFRGLGRRRGATDHGLIVAPAPGEVRTDLARYTMRVSLYSGEAGGTGAMILASIERSTPVPRPDADLRDRFGLTPAEIRVARLIAEGRSNGEIADALFISPHTARRHTERVLHKLEARSRAGVAAKVLY